MVQQNESVSDVNFLEKKKSHQNRPRNRDPVDSSVLEKLDVAFNNYFEQQESSDYARVLLVKDLEATLDVNKAHQLVQLWNFYSNNNDHGAHTNATLKLQMVISHGTESAKLKQVVDSLIRKELLVTSSLKVVYRGLSSMRPATANPLLKLLYEIIRFENGLFVDDFVRIFDFGLVVLPKLMTPSKQEIAAGNRLGPRAIRYNLMKLWNGLMANSSSVTRKDLLSSESANFRKIVGSLFKYCAQFDSIDLIAESLKIWDSKILSDTFINRFRTIVLRHFNQWNIKALVPLFHLSDESIDSTFKSFILKLLIDQKVGVSVSPSPWYAQSTSESQDIVVGNKKFRVYNKFIYNTLVALKPWEDKSQLEVVVKVLSVLPELVPPYAENMKQVTNNFDPKLTFYWIGNALLVQRIINLPVHKVDSFSSYPDNSLVIEHFLPCCLNISSLSACLRGSDLIRQLALQLLAASFIKFFKIMDLYEANDWNEAAAQLSTKFFNSIPDIGLLIQTFKFAATVKNKILLLSSLKVINRYLRAFSTANFVQSFSILSDHFNELINGKFDLQGSNLMLLKEFFTLQELVNSSNDSLMSFKISQKWYSSSKGHSLFTNLLKLSLHDTSESGFDGSVLSLLQKLVDSTLMFNEYKSETNTILVSQLLALIGSLKLFQKCQSDDSLKMNALWDLMDQSVSRIMTPYKYVDLSNKDFSGVSPFVVTVFEQFQYIEQSDICLLWLQLFAQYLITIGEPREGLISLFGKYCDSDVDFKFANFETLLNSFDSEVINEIMNNKLTFFEVIMNCDPHRLNQVKEIPINSLDVLGILIQLRNVVNENFNQKLFQSVTDKLYNVLCHSNDEDIFVVVYKFLFNFEDSEKLVEFIGPILQQVLEENTSSRPSYLYQIVLRYSEHIEHKTFEKSSTWALRKETLLKVLLEVEGSRSIYGCLLEVLKRQISLPLLQFSHIVSKVEQHVNVDLDCEYLLCQIVKRKLLVFDDSDIGTHFDLVNNIKLTNLFKSLIFTYPELTDSLSNKKLSDSSLRSLALCGFFESFSDVQKNRLYGLCENALNSSEDKIETLNLVSSCLTAFEDDQLELLESFFFEKNDIFSSSALKLAEFLKSKRDSELLEVYFGKSILYINKKFAETDAMTPGFESYLCSLAEMLKDSSILSGVPTNLINTQFEIVLGKSSWINYYQVLQYLISALESASGLNYMRLLEIFLNNEKLPLMEKGESEAKFLSSIILHKLFTTDAEKHSNFSIREKILLCYGGTASASDLIMFSTLNNIEKYLNMSWMNSYVTTWEFQNPQVGNMADFYNEMMEEKLFRKDRTGTVKITLNGSYLRIVKESLKDFDSLSGENYFAVRKKFQQFYDKMFQNSNGYDPRLVMLLVLNNQEILQSNEEEPSTPVFDIRALVSSGLLRYFILCLASKDVEVTRLAQTVLFNVSESATNTSNTFRDQDLIRVLLLKILCSFKARTPQDFPPVLYYQLAEMVPIVVNPAHFLYEKVYKYLLGMVDLSLTDMPLFRSIIAVPEPSSFTSDALWLLNVLGDGVKMLQDVEFLRKRQVIDWIISLKDSPLANKRIKRAALYALSKLEDVDGGAQILMIKYGLHSDLQMSNNDFEIGLVDKQLQLDTQALQLKTDIYARNLKRLQEWTKEGPNLKRLRPPEKSTTN